MQLRPPGLCTAHYRLAPVAIPCPMCLRTSKYLVPRSWVATHGGPDPVPGSYFGPQNGHPPEVPNRLVAMIPVALWRNYPFPIPPCNGPLGHVRRSTGNGLELTPACRPSDPPKGVPTPDIGYEVLFGSHSGPFGGPVGPILASFFNA